MTITTRLFTTFCGELVGTDAAGNRYYRQKGPAHRSDTDNRKREKRWVRYANATFLGELLGGGLPDPSRVPPEWHGWLHYTHDVPPSQAPVKHYHWEKPPIANLTGTQAAYLPPGHLLKGGHRSPTTSDYEPWKP